MDKETFIRVMKIVHKALYEIKNITDPDEIKILNDLLIAYVSMIAGFHEWLYESLHTFLLNHNTVTDESLGDLYDMLTVSYTDQNS